MNWKRCCTGWFVAWIGAFKKYISPDPHSPSVARPGDVWVDTELEKSFSGQDRHPTARPAKVPTCLWPGPWNADLWKLQTNLKTDRL
jgi:hypothetical protein